jgi:thiosulfate/3-mercaptopyruvate sulfurtransferase
MTKRSIEPIVSTDWLESQLGSKGPAIIDLRSTEDYEVGHIPGAISVPFSPVSAWADSDDELLLELPPKDDLLGTIGECGLSAESRVVMVGGAPGPHEPPYALADPLRVASTLIYAGVTQVAVLSGGHAKWADEGRKTTKDVPRVASVSYSSSVDAVTWVGTGYVKERIGKAVLIDGRDPDQYFGASVDPFTEERGHIPSARSLPLPWVWEPDYTYRPFSLIAEMAGGVVGADRSQEIICYCGVGGYGSGWWFLLTQLLGYPNVKIYDGSIEAWANGKNPLVSYTWTQ